MSKFCAWHRQQRRRCRWRQGYDNTSMFSSKTAELKILLLMKARKFLYEFRESMTLHLQCCLPKAVLWPYPYPNPDKMWSELKVVIVTVDDMLVDEVSHTRVQSLSWICESGRNILSWPFSDDTLGNCIKERNIMLNWTKEYKDNYADIACTQAKSGTFLITMGP